MYLIAGLGNPGPEYGQTRHNVGYRVLEAWAESLGVRWAERRFQSRSARAVLQGESLMLLCPTTFMNRSGEAVRACAHYYKIEGDRILIVHDDLDLPLGRIRVVRGGGSGGHKGVASVMNHLGTTAFARVRIGIGRPDGDQPVERFVLTPFDGNERDVVLHVIQLGIQACELFIVQGVDAAMQAINGQNLTQARRE